MALVYKTGVDPAGMERPIEYAVAVAEQLYARRGATLTVTSLREGVHIPGSLHPVGLAADLRIHNLAAGQAALIARELAAALDGDYDVILEADHIHVEYDPPGGALLLQRPTVRNGNTEGPFLTPEAALLPAEFRLWDFIGPSGAATVVYQPQAAAWLGVPWWGWALGGLLAVAALAGRRR